MHMAKTSSCLEACRAAALASHSAAGLLTTVRKVACPDAAAFLEAMRLLRTSEALARSAVACLSGIKTHGPVADASSTRDDQAPLTHSTGSKSRRRRRKNKSAAMDTTTGDSAAGADGSKPEPARLALALGTSGSETGPEKDPGTRGSTAAPQTLLKTDAVPLLIQGVVGLATLWASRPPVTLAEALKLLDEIQLLAMNCADG